MPGPVTLSEMVRGWLRLPERPPETQYTTQLSPEEEERFQEWARRNGIRMEPGWNEDYDMRGLWKSNPQMSADVRGHFPDTYKKPFHPTFSNESVYATPDAPHWAGSRLFDRDGRLIADETPDIVPPQPVTLSDMVRIKKRK
jgi:hypothetical protein